MGNKYESYIKIIQFLIKDEHEAIEGYDDAIKKFKGNDEIISELIHIRDEEKEHIEELEKLIDIL